MMIRIIRSNYNSEETVLLADAYKWHLSTLFTGGMAQVNSTVVPVDGRMTFLCNPGDRFIHRLAKAESRILYEGWALQQPLVNGKLAIPSRAQTAQWHYMALGKITPRQIVRSFVACRALGLEDYSDEDCKKYGLHELVKSSSERSIKEVLDDNELAAQLDDVDDEDEAWLHEEATPHRPAGPCDNAAAATAAAAAAADDSPTSAANAAVTSEPDDDEVSLPACPFPARPALIIL